jgi:D-amino-acid dehydrogenase
MDVPLDTERGYGVVLNGTGLQLSLPVIVEDFHFAVRAVGDELRLIGISELGGLRAPPDPRLWNRILRAAKIVFPELRPTAQRGWMSYRPSMPDSLPVIGRVPGRHGVILAFGHGHKGLGLGAVTGKLVAELADAAETSVDLAPYSPSRFRRAAARR